MTNTTHATRQHPGEDGEPTTAQLLAELWAAQSVMQAASRWREASIDETLQMLLAGLGVDACAALPQARYSTTVALWPSFAEGGAMTWTHVLVLVRWNGARGAVLAARPATPAETAEYDAAGLREAGHLAPATERDRVRFAYEVHELLHNLRVDADQTTDALTGQAALVSL